MFADGLAKVVPEDLLRYAADDLPDGLLSGSGLGELCNKGVTMIVPAPRHVRVLPHNGITSYG